MSSVYFCEGCGSILPEDLRLNSLDHKNIRKIQSKNRDRETLNLIKQGFSNFSSLISVRSVVIGFVLGLMVSSVFVLIFRTGFLDYYLKITGPKSSDAHVVTTDSSRTSLDDAQNPSTQQTDYINLGLGIKSGSFDQHEVRGYVPYEASFYMELNDTSTLEPYFGFLDGEIFTLNESIKDNVEPFYSAFYMTKGVRSGWVILLFLKDLSVDVGNYNTILVDNIDNILIVSLEPSLIDEVKLAKSEVVKNLSMHPSLISMKSQLPDSGQIFIFKFKKDGDGVVEELENDTLSEEFKMVLKNYIDLGTPYLVIK